MDIKRNGSQPSAKGPADWFTGAVRIDPLFQPNDPHVRQRPVLLLSRAHCLAHPPARANINNPEWLGTAESGPVEEVNPGDVIWFAPGEKHWHGATPTKGMVHIAIQEQLNGKVVDWMEHVTDSQYHQL